MAVSWLLLGVKITKAGSFSSSYIGTFLEGYLLLVISATEREEGVKRRTSRQSKQDHNKF